MRRQDESKKSVILDFIDEYYNEHNEIPAVRTIAEGTGIALATVHRYLLSLKESGELEKLPQELQTVANARLDNPDLSLNELVDVIEPPISKSGLNHRLNKIIKISENQ